MWSMLHFVSVWRIARAARRELVRFSDRDLEDIGLDPCEVFSRKRRP